MERHHGYLQNLFDMCRCVLGFGLLIGQASAVPANKLSVAPSQGTNASKISAGCVMHIVVGMHQIITLITAITLRLLRPELLLRAWSLRLCDVRHLPVVDPPAHPSPWFFRAAAVAKASLGAPVILKMPPQQTKSA